MCDLPIKQFAYVCIESCKLSHNMVETKPYLARNNLLLDAQV